MDDFLSKGLKGEKMKRLVLLLLTLGKILLADAVEVAQIAQKATFRIVNLAAQGTETGFLINDKGYVITNNHVTEGYQQGKLLVLNKYNKYEAVKVVKTYPNQDITILKIENYTDGEFLKLQSPELIQKGHASFSLGYPGGSDIVGDDDALQDSTIKSGDVSKILTTSSGDGDFPTGYKLIETSSDINGGNSGGPLLSRLGTVIGINTFKSNDTATLVTGGSIVQGIFWAIHVEELIKVLKENNIAYTLSTEDIGEVNTGDIQENIDEVQSNNKIIFIVIGLIIAFGILLFSLIKKSSAGNVKQKELSKLLRDKMKKYRSREEIHQEPSPTPSPKPKPKPKKEKTKVVLEMLVPEDSSLPKIHLESKKSITIGRDNGCDIVINDSEVSKKHLRITLIGTLVEIEDLDSSNSTYIDGKKLDAHKKVMLQKNERLIIASEKNVYAIKGSEVRKASPSIELIPKDSSLPAITIKGRMTLGRSSESNVVIDNSEVSRIHLEVQLDNGKLTIKDLGSANGTYINGKKNEVGKSIYLNKGDQLVIGSEDVVYQIR